MHGEIKSGLNEIQMIKDELVVTWRGQKGSIVEALFMSGTVSYCLNLEISWSSRIWFLQGRIDEERCSKDP